MGKKKRLELERQKERFVNGAVNNGITKDTAIFIFKKIEPFAEYGFNKSHAAAHALIAYQTAYLKHYHKEEFIAATMSTELSNTDKLREFVQELKRLNIEIVRPSINKCYADFKTEENKIYYALSGIKSVGYEAISNIVKEREKNGTFKSLQDFIKRTNPKNINKLQLEGLVKAGAFDKICKNRSSLFNSIPKLIQVSKSIWEEKNSMQNNLFQENSDKNIEIFNLEKTKEWTTKEVLMNEFHSIGFYMSDHPLKVYEKYLRQSKVISFNEFINGNYNNAVVAGTIMSIQEKKSIKGSPFAIIKFSDLKDEFELFLFSDLLVQKRNQLKAANSFILTLQKDSSFNGSETRRINVKNIIDINDLINTSHEQVMIEIREKSDFSQLRDLLKESGKTKVKIKIGSMSKAYIFELKNPRKFNFKTFSSIKDKEFIKKISF